MFKSKKAGRGRVGLRPISVHPVFIITIVLCFAALLPTAQIAAESSPEVPSPAQYSVEDTTTRALSTGPFPDCFSYVLCDAARGCDPNKLLPLVVPLPDGHIAACSATLIDAQGTIYFFDFMTPENDAYSFSKTIGAVTAANFHPHVWGEPLSIEVADKALSFAYLQINLIPWPEELPCSPEEPFWPECRKPDSVLHFLPIITWTTPFEI